MVVNAVLHMKATAWCESTYSRTTKITTRGCPNHPQHLNNKTRYGLLNTRK